MRRPILLLLLFAFLLLPVSVCRGLDGTWDRVRVPFLQYFYSVHFVDDLHGWAGGMNLYKTTDGGRTWQAIDLHLINHIYDIRFIDKDRGFLASGLNGLLYTGDGGSTRRNAAENLPGASVEVVFFIDESAGWIVADVEEGGKASYALFRTRDGGGTWKDVSPPELGADWAYEVDGLSIYKRMIFFIDENRGWLRTLSALMYTDNGGDTWSAALAGNIFDFQVLDGGETVIAITGGSGDLRSISVSTDSGKSFTSTPVPEIELYKLFFLNKDLGWAASGTEIYHTVDGGLEWKLQYTTPYDSLVSKYTPGYRITPNIPFIYDMFFCADSSGWAVGGGNIFFRFTPLGEAGPGDINDDGSLDIFDILELFRVIGHNNRLYRAIGYGRTDMDGDGDYDDEDDLAKYQARRNLRLSHGDLDGNDRVDSQDILELLLILINQ